MATKQQQGRKPSAKPAPTAKPIPAPPIPRPPSIIISRMTRRMASLTAGELRGLLVYLLEHEWQRDAVEAAQGKAFEPLGLFAMRHSVKGEIRPTAAYLVRVQRAEEGPGRPERTFVTSIYLAEDLRTMRVYVRLGDGVPEGNRLATIKLAVDPEEDRAPDAPSARTRARAGRSARASRSTSADGDRARPESSRRASVATRDRGARRPRARTARRPA